MATASLLPVPVAEGREPWALLRDALAALAAEPCEGFEFPVLRSDTEELRRAMDLLECQFLRRVGCVERLWELFSDGMGSLVSWLRMACRLSGGSAVERVEVLRQLATLPLTGEALARGDIGYEHARVIARTAAEMGSAVVQGAEPALLLTAQEVDPSRLNEVAQEVVHRLDPEAASDAARRLHERRRVRLHGTADRGFGLEGVLTPEGGAMLTTALNALMTPVPGDRRTTMQRRHDALVELARRQLQGRALPQVAGQRPHLTITVSAETLAGDGASGASAGASAELGAPGVSGRSGVSGAVGRVGGSQAWLGGGGSA